MLLQLLAWATVFIGLVLTLSAYQAVVYFRRQIRIAGGSWVLVAFLRTTQTITAAAAWFTLARAVTLTFGPMPWISAISGLVVIWLLLIPALLRSEFRSHEGR
jgi:hypothetical protein